MELNHFKQFVSFLNSFENSFYHNFFRKLTALILFRMDALEMLDMNGDKASMEQKNFSPESLKDSTAWEQGKIFFLLQIR